MSKKTITTAEGNKYTFDTKTRVILSRLDKHGNIYNAQGKKLGHINDNPKES